MTASAHDSIHQVGTTIRPLERTDRSAILELLSATGVFNDAELAIALELVDVVLDKPHQEDYIINVYDDGHGVAGYYCVGPTPATEGTYDLYWIAVDPQRHGKGIGTLLLRHAEAVVLSRKGRLMIVETSSRPSYELTRRFYKSSGYTILAEIKGYYRTDDDLVVFGKYVSQYSED